MKGWVYIFNFMSHVHGQTISKWFFICRQGLGHFIINFKGLCIRSRLLHVPLPVLKAQRHFGHVAEGYGAKSPRIWSFYCRVSNSDWNFVILILNWVILPTHICYQMIAGLILRSISAIKVIGLYIYGWQITDAMQN